MSMETMHTVVCPNCSKEQIIARYDSINDYNQEMFSKIIDKSIFTYVCSKCEEKITEPYPLLFHKMSFRDIQIGYKITPISNVSKMFKNPLFKAMKIAMSKDRVETNDISERYDDVDEFIDRVKEFVN